jgi:choline kinase
MVEPIATPHRAVILAAGRGERLVNGQSFPKPMKQVTGSPLLVRILRNLERAGVSDVAVVIGHLGDVIAAAIARTNFALDIQLIENDEYDLPNGVSVLAAADFVRGPTFLMMADHLWSPDLFEAVASYPLAPDEAVLGVDFNIARCFDIPDATKVRVQGDRVVAISKELEHYDALDTGVFRITPALIDSLRVARGPAGCSLSDGVRQLASEGRMRVADVGDAYWIDVDTPEAHAEAERLIADRGDTLRPPPPR